MWVIKFEDRLKSWVDLRESINNCQPDQLLSQIAMWWSHAPLINNAIHWQDINNWPNPWDLLANNRFCDLALALGMSYTILMLDDLRLNIELAQVTNDQGTSFNVVLINDGEYILNLIPRIVVNSQQEKFKIMNSYSSKQLRKLMDTA